MKVETISRPNVNSGFDFEEAMLEAIDDAFEAAGKPTVVDCWIFEENNDSSYIIADKSGGTNLKEVFAISSEKKISQRFANVEEIYERTGMFGAGSLSHLNVSNKVYYLTRNDGEWEALIMEKELETGDFNKKYIPLDQIDVLSLSKLNSRIDIDQYDSVLFVTGVNMATNQTVNDFKEKSYYYGLEKNLRSTYAKRLSNGYVIRLNGKKLKPLDVFYLDCIDLGVVELLKIEITLSELLQLNSYFKEDIFKRYLEVYNNSFHEEAEQRLLQEKIVVNFFGYDTKYFNKVYFEQIKPNDRVMFNQQSSGAWIYRNERKVGNPKLPSFIKTIHPGWNGFRARIDFSPIFDVYFGIQVNKNRYVISDEVQELIKMKMNEEYGNNGASRISDIIKSYNYIPIPLQQLTFDIDVDDKIVDELWKQAEEAGLKELKRLGYNIEDVTSKKMGYDFEAKHTVSSEVRYVEVKRIKKVGEGFSLTPKEYTLSLSLAEKYFICLVLLKETEVSFIWINNPHKSILFEEIVKIESYKATGYSSDNEYSVKRTDLV